MTTDLNELLKNLGHVNGRTSAVYELCAALVRQLGEGSRLITEADTEIPVAGDTEPDPIPEPEETIPVLDSDSTLPELILAFVSNGNIDRSALRAVISTVHPDVKLGPNGFYFYKTVTRMIKDGRLRETGTKRLALASQEATVSEPEEP